MRDPFYVALERSYNYYKIVVASALLIFAIGAVSEIIMGGTYMTALQFGLSLLVWGVFLRTVLVWHQTWAVNSISHLWGYRNYETGEGSKNNFLVGFLSNGEGWHNNHHAFPSAASHGHRWWELDVTFLTIRLLGHLGLASRIVLRRD